MASYADLVRKLESGKLNKLYWLCGSEKILREQGLEAIRVMADVEPHDSVTLFAKKKGNAEVWAQMSQHAVDPRTRRLIVVRNAHIMSDLAKLSDWLDGARYANVHVVMVSDLAEWKPDYLPEVRKRVTGSGSSLYVECKLSKGAGTKNDPKDSRGRFYTKAEQQAAAIISEHWSQHLSLELSLELARRTACDLRRCLDVSRWVNILKEANPAWTITSGVLEKLAPPSSSMSFTDALLSLDKPTAMGAAFHLSEDTDRRRAIIDLQKNLSYLEAMNRGIRVVVQKYGGDRSKANLAIRELAHSTNVPVGAATRLWDYVRLYPPATVSRRTEALIRADQAIRETGVLETLVTEW